MRRRIKGLQLKPLKRKEILALYQRAFYTINRELFNKELPCIEILPGTGNMKNICACFEFDPERKADPKIILDMQGIPEQGINTDTLNDLFHEMAHYYCYLKRIEDTTGNDYHNTQFKAIVERFGGKCLYVDNKNGFCDARLNGNILEKIFSEI